MTGPEYEMPKSTKDLIHLLELLVAIQAMGDRATPEFNTNREEQ